MPDIIKTWPGFMEPRRVLRIFGQACPFKRYYFSLGRGKPKVQPSKIWFTYRGRILGSLPVSAIRQNDGSLPPLRSIENKESAWQFKDDIWVLICEPPIVRLREHLYMSGFRGWRYFDLDKYRQSPDARWNV